MQFGQKNTEALWPQGGRGCSQPCSGKLGHPPKQDTHRVSPISLNSTCMFGTKSHRHRGKPTEGWLKINKSRVRSPRKRAEILAG